MSSDFKFFSNTGESFSVVSFRATEGISQLYQYEIELKAPVSRAIDLDDILADSASFISVQGGIEYPVHGILASFDEMQTAQGYVYFKAVLVPTLWKLSIYKTNEIYTAEKTVDVILQTVLENAGLTSGTDFEMGLLNTDYLLSRDYICQFAESDFDFLSRIMENEGIYYYFDQSGAQEKVIFANDGNYSALDKPDLVYEADSSKSNKEHHVSSWICRKKRLPESVSVRDYNSSQPSQDVFDSISVDTLGTGTEYLYGGNVQDSNEASYLTQLRADELIGHKTRFYGESSVSRLQSGYSVNLEGHPNSKYNGQDYLILEVSHEGSNLDTVQTNRASKVQSQYRNSFTAIQSQTQFRPPLTTAKPRFYGTMTAFIYAETGGDRPEVDDLGRYRVHLPFDKADGTLSSTDPDRKASAWIRMAQPYVGQDQGMYFPLTGGTEVLLTFINGDPDQPIISAALPNAAQPSLMEENPEWASSVTTLTSLNITGNRQNISMNSARLTALEPSNPIPTTANAHFINEGSASMIPPSTGMEVTDNSPAYDDQYVKFKYYNKDLVAVDMTTDHINNDMAGTDRGAGDNYIYANGRTFVYPQHERVYFIGSFHEEFHVKDDFITMKTDGSYNSWTGVKEQFNFPAPGEDFPSGKKGEDNSDAEVNTTGIRGVSEDKRWGDQMNYAWGRSFNWGGGPLLDHPDDATKNGGSFGAYNYGNSYTENLLIATGGTSEDLTDTQKEHADDYQSYPQFTDDLGSTSVDKTFGPTYSYQNGFSLDIKVGDSYERVYGNKNEEVHSHWVSHVYGSSHEVRHGASNEMFMGAKNEMNLAATSEINLSAASSIVGGISSAFFLGGETELKISWSNSFHFGLDTGLQLAGFLKYTGGFGIDKTSAYLDDADARIAGAKAQIKTIKAKIDDIAFEIKCIPSSIIMGNFQLTM